MHFPESKKTVEQYSDAALSRMKDLGLVPNYVNYTLWYAYESGANESLKCELDELLAARSPHILNAEYCGEIYERYFGIQTANIALDEAARRIDEAVNRMRPNLVAARRSVTDYSENLVASSGKLKPNIGSDSLQSLIQEILESTLQMAKGQRKFAKKVNESMKEISILRRSVKDARQQSLIDPLTSVASREYFDERLTAAIDDAKEGNYSLSLLMINVDHLADFNKKYGHHMGDAVLKFVVRIFNERIRGHDTPARYFDGNFAILMPGTEVENAIKFGDWIRRKANKKRIANRATGAELGKITLSVGVASYKYGEPAKRFTGRACEALSMAKRGGRNRVASEDGLARYAEAS